MFEVIEAWILWRNNFASGAKGKIYQPEKVKGKFSKVPLKINLWTLLYKYYSRTSKFLFYSNRLEINVSKESKKRYMRELKLWGNIIMYTLTQLMKKSLTH